MRNLYALLLCMLTISSVSAQHVNYNSSKWFWGLNYGGTWHSTDLDYERYNGWGLTLGRSYNYDYGRGLSFDLRGRFLAGQWYGISDSISILSPSVNPVLSSYLTGNNQYVYNFRSDIRELDLELVLMQGASENALASILIFLVVWASPGSKHGPISQTPTVFMTTIA